ncbi:MAG: chloride channel protein [Chitinophagales bacterium]|nr:MAG: chloride channel protein [Chitinophagales bacterium]
MKQTKIYQYALKWLQRSGGPYQLVIGLSVAIGLLSGIAAIVLKSFIHYIEAYGVGFIPSYQLFLTPITGILLAVLLNQTVFKKAGLFHGVGDIIVSIIRKSGIMDFHLVYAKLITSAITVGFGGSSGLESPIVVTGSAIGSNVGRLFKMDVNYRVLFIGCGAAAGIAAIFNAPIAGVVFAMEVIMPRFTATYFIPTLLASASGALLVTVFSPRSIFSIAHLDLTYAYNHLPFIVLLGVAGGFVSLYFTYSSWVLKSWFLKIRNVYQKAITGGVLLGILIFCFPRLYGEGYVGISMLFNKSGIELLPPFLKDSPYSLDLWLPLVFAALLLLKPLAANITIHAGGEGGNFAPSFITGGYLGYLFFILADHFFPSVGLSAPVCILLGMSSVLSGVMHAPLTGIFLVAEITGSYSLLVPLMLVSAIAFLTKYRIDKRPIHFDREGAPYDLSRQELATLDAIDLMGLTDKDYSVFKPDYTLKEMVDIVSKSRRNFFPVISDDQILLGVITLDDLRSVMFNPEQHSNLRAKNLMHLPPDYLEYNEGLFSALEKFDRTNYWNLPVLKDGKFAGFVSKSTILDRLRKEIDRSREIF